jgi:hypothetical protein
MELLKPASVLYSGVVGESIDCCICTEKFIPRNSEDESLRICLSCERNINDNTSGFGDSDEDENNVSYFTICKNIFLI